MPSLGQTTRGPVAMLAVVNRRRRRTTAREFLDQLARDPEWVARRNVAEAKRSELEHRLAHEQLPLIRALERAGVEVESVWDLVNTADPYRSALGVLLEHLEHPYSPRILEGIARALVTKDARPMWGEI